MLVWGDYSPAGGRSRQVADLAAELMRRGHDVVTIDVRSWRDLRSALGSEVDVVHSHGGLATAAALLFRRRRGRPRHVVSLHGWHPGLLARVENLAERVGLVHSHAITVPNPTMIDRLPARSALRAIVVPTGVSAPPQAGRGVGVDILTVLWLGRVCREKGIDTAVAAVVEARRTQPRLRLEVVGPLNDALARELAAAPPAGVRFHGHVPDPWRAFAAQLLLHTPHYDAGPRSVAEALGAGVPVVATRVGGLPSMVRDGIDGLLAPNGDVPGLAAHLTSLAADPERLAAMSRAARDAYWAEHSLEAMGQRIEAVYDRVVE